MRHWGVEYDFACLGLIGAEEAPPSAFSDQGHHDAEGLSLLRPALLLVVGRHRNYDRRLPGVIRLWALPQTSDTA